MGLRAFLAGWRTVSFSRSDRTAVFDAMFGASIPITRERVRGERVSARIREEDVRAASLVFASLGIEAEIGERHGLPAALAFCRERPGIPVGLLLVALWLNFSGGLVWDIRIEGNTKTSAETITAQLSDLGFEIGTRWRGIDFDQLHADYVAVQNDIAWLSVYMNGTVAQVQVREMWADGVRGDRTHTGANVVAAETGVIEEVNVFEGQAAVRAGDVIRPGEVAISGILEKKDGGFRWEYAAGEVWASVAVPLAVEIPLERLEKRPTGEKKTAFALKIFKKTINLSENYGFDPSTYDKIDTIGRVCLPDGTPLPVWVEKTVWQRTEAVPVTISADDAQAEAMTEMRRLVREATQDGVLLEKSFRGSLRDGVWRLDGLLSVSRQIGVTEEFAVEDEKPSFRRTYGTEENHDGLLGGHGAAFRQF